MSGRVSFHLFAHGRDDLRVEVRDGDGLFLAEELFRPSQCHAPIVREELALWIHDRASPVHCDVPVDWGRAYTVDAKLGAAVRACRTYLQQET